MALVVTWLNFCVQCLIATFLAFKYTHTHISRTVSTKRRQTSIIIAWKNMLDLYYLHVLVAYIYCSSKRSSLIYLCSLVYICWINRTVLRWIWARRALPFGSSRRDELIPRVERSDTNRLILAISRCSRGLEVTRQVAISPGSFQCRPPDITQTARGNKNEPRDAQMRRIDANSIYVCFLGKFRQLRRIKCFVYHAHGVLSACTVISVCVAVLLPLPLQVLWTREYRRIDKSSRALCPAHYG